MSKDLFCEIFFSLMRFSTYSVEDLDKGMRSDAFVGQGNAGDDGKTLLFCGINELEVPALEEGWAFSIPMIALWVEIEHQTLEEIPVHKVLSVSDTLNFGIQTCKRVVQVL